ncbi:MAG: F0F1 ATP synthase subunit epsilon [Pararhizobium sp.]
MPGPFTFELVSPERLLVSEEVSQVVIPGSDGEMTVMADHAPLMTTIKPGVVTITTTGGKTDRYVVFGGFADVLPRTCTLLAESAMHVDNINREDIQSRIRDAQEDLNDEQDEEKKATLGQYLDQLTTLEGAILPA